MGGGAFRGQRRACNACGIGDFNNDGFLDVVTGNTTYQNQPNAEQMGEIQSGRFDVK